jgi:hypothetical protein
MYMCVSVWLPCEKSAHLDLRSPLYIVAEDGEHHTQENTDTEKEAAVLVILNIVFIIRISNLFLIIFSK